ncbi:transmembrane protein, putative [Medicago truncatula]|uniref:Transmembrane protein, putative n=1 Tax=Medicago truncatula TaxID=3880 RepID=G7IQF7_MEDTR|nr:transmembrane protein, putative [Medicago truncatula]
MNGVKGILRRRKINFDQVHIQSITFASPTLQIWKHEYFGGLNIVMFVDTCTLPFYAINMNIMSLFAYSFFF